MKDTAQAEAKENLSPPQPASLHPPQNGVSMNSPLGMAGWGLLTSI